MEINRSKCWRRPNWRGVSSAFRDGASASPEPPAAKKRLEGAQPLISSPRELTYSGLEHTLIEKTVLNVTFTRLAPFFPSIPLRVAPDALPRGPCHEILH
jgi:hypothetical protein